MSGIIIREAILPQFKQNPPDYGGGIKAGADAIIKQMSLPPDQAQATSRRQRKRSSARATPAAASSRCLLDDRSSASSLLSFAPPRRRPALSSRGGGGGISPWVVLWGLNELSRGSRGGGGWGGGGGFGGAAAAEAAASAASPAAADRSAAAAASGQLVMLSLSEADHDKVSAAIAAAEAKANGEIVAVATPISDPYHDVALHWAVAVLIAVLAWAAWRPDWLQWWYDTAAGRLARRSDLGRAADVPDGASRSLKFTVGAADPQIHAAAARADARRDQAPPRAPPRRDRVQGGRRAADRRAAPESSSICRWPSAAPRSSPTRRSLKVTDAHTWGEAMAALAGRSAGRTSGRRDRCGDRARRRRCSPSISRAPPATPTKFPTS